MDYINGSSFCCSGVKQQMEDDLLMEERENHHINDSNNDDDDDEGEEEEDDDEESQSVVLHDCARPCHFVAEPSHPPPPPPPPPPRRSRPRSPPPNFHSAAAVRHHHHHHHQNQCRASSPLTIHCQSSPRPRPGAVTCSLRWDVALLQALRRDPLSNPQREKYSSSCGRRRQPGRVDSSFIPKKGDLIIHHDSSQWRRVLEFYDPVSQRLQDGDILIRVRIDSFSCVGILLMKGTGYMYHRGYWMFLGTDSDQISQLFRGN